MERTLRKTLRGGKFKNVPAVRSKTMSAIRGKNNRTTELCFRMALVRAGIKGWETNAEDLAGRPDFFFCKKRIAVFIDGCFWHGCPKCGHYPKTRSKFWKTKILRNKERDKRNRHILRKHGIKVVSIWEHFLASYRGITSKIKILKQLLSS
ncbi:MAG: DNA mismatch endonuclease Vsr [Sedimentisphaerales bacterium]|nr:DNA mismatch endonuclease Vsr [Sedimentisphaerales bacterium]